MIELLFKTNAFKVSQSDRPFWYTSGKIGPFYINTHYLYGNGYEAEDLLNKIDNLKNDKASLIQMLENEITKQYQENEVYRKAIDSMIVKLKESIDLNEVDYISGGERRDWFFSVIIAKLLNKKHIYLFKNDTPVLVDGDITLGRSLHIADLITEGSSYERAWIPQLKEYNITMPYTLVCVDRKQGGDTLLKDMGVNVISMVNVDKTLFDRALNLNLINNSQYQMLCDYMEDPDGAMKRFIDTNYAFLENALKSDDKTIERAKLCIEKGFYR